MHTRKKAFVSTADNDNDKEKITSYCPKCESFGFYSKLGERVYDNDIIDIPSDHDNWLQCYRCGLLLPKVHAKRETKIKGFIEIPDTIHDSGKTIATAINPRKLPYKRKSYNRDEQDPLKIDPDIQRMMRKQGNQLVSYQDSNY